MDIESNVEMTKQPFLAGVASLPSPKSHAEQIRDPNFNPEDDDEYLEQLPEWTMAEIATALGAVGSIITSSVALLFAGINPIIWVTAIAGIIIPPYSALQQQKITDCKALEQSNEAMERELENLKYNNERLQGENEKLSKSVQKFQDMKDAFEECQNMGKISITELKQQLEESKRALAQMQVNRTNEIMDNVFDVLIAADRDENWELEDHEIDAMIKKLEGIVGVNVKHAALKNLIIREGRNLDSVMALLRKLLDDDPNTVVDDGGETIIEIED